MLGEFSFKGLSPEEVVREAVAAIPENFANKSYFSYSSYRQYKKINDEFVNLYEGQIVTMFRLKKNKKEIVADEAFAARHLRKTRYLSNLTNVIEDNAADLLAENPIYHLASSALLPSKLYSYYLSFDTSNKTDDYVINYLCSAYSTERHGILFSGKWPFSGESYETGRIVIDRSSFAFKKITRKSYRNPAYSYYLNPNDFCDRKRHYYEFGGGELDAEYEPHDGKWYLKALYHKYTNNFFVTGFATNDYVNTDVFEWRSDSVSRYITKDLLNSFRYRMKNTSYTEAPSIQPWFMMSGETFCWVSILTIAGPAICAARAYISDSASGAAASGTTPRLDPASALLCGSCQRIWRLGRTNPPSRKAPTTSSAGRQKERRFRLSSGKGRFIASPLSIKRLDFVLFWKRTRPISTAVYSVRRPGRSCGFS